MNASRRLFLHNEKRYRFLLKFSFFQEIQNILYMKNIPSLIFAGIIGGMITLSGNYFFQSNQQVTTPSTPTYAQTISNVNVPAGNSSAPFDFTDAANIATPAVVHISAAESNAAAQRRQQQQPRDPFRGFFDLPFDSPNQIRQGMGSGVILSEDGYIVTNNHVVEFADIVEVTLFDNRQFQAQVVGTDTKTDLAVLKIEASGLPTLRRADSDEAQIGQWVLAVGNPLDLTSTVTAGIISAKGRDINIISGNDAIEAFIQTDAAVNPGNSGGALVDAQGRLLGINTAIATRTGYFSGYSFAIPVNMMTKIVDDIIEFGSYQRGYLGIGISDLDNEYADELGLNITQGVLVEYVEDGSAAQYAGLLPNDVIVAIDGKMVKSSPGLQEIVGRAKVGDRLNLTINRNGKTDDLSVRLKARE